MVDGHRKRNCQFETLPMPLMKIPCFAMTSSLQCNDGTLVVIAGLSHPLNPLLACHETTDMSLIGPSLKL
jgi:hypothetical protein